MMPGEPAPLSPEEVTHLEKLGAPAIWVATVRDRERQRDELQRQLDVARKAIRTLLVKWDKIEPIVNRHLALEAVHGRPYNGPNMASELAELRRIAGGKNTTSPFDNPEEHECHD
jgi:hypothetical protein